MLSLPVALDGSGVSLAIWLRVTGMLVSPLLAAFANNPGGEGIGTNFSPVIIPLSLTLTGGLAANRLLGMVRGRLKKPAGNNGANSSGNPGSACPSLILPRSRV